MTRNISELLVEDISRLTPREAIFWLNNPEAFGEYLAQTIRRMPTDAELSICLKTLKQVTNAHTTTPDNLIRVNDFMHAMQDNLSLLEAAHFLAHPICMSGAFSRVFSRYPTKLETVRMQAIAIATIERHHNKEGEH